MVMMVSIRNVEQITGLHSQIIMKRVNKELVVLSFSCLSLSAV